MCSLPAVLFFNCNHFPANAVLCHVKVNVFWFRRDLRLEDNAGLHHALRAGLPVLPVFIFDTDILSLLPSPKDARVEFIHQSLSALHTQLQALGSGLRVMHGTPLSAMEALCDSMEVQAVFTNRDYEPQAMQRDETVAAALARRGIAFHTFKDQVIFEREEVLTDADRPYTVFTPYSRKWKQRLMLQPVQPFHNAPLFSHFIQEAQPAMPSLKALGFEPAGIPFPSAQPPDSILRSYDATRDIPGVEGTSRLSLHLRFGTVSVRACVLRAQRLNEVFLNELIWREFFMQVLYHFPQVVHQPFKPQYERVQWRREEADFEKWKQGLTGFPMVDAGMRELKATGHMHNRVRMITANFLVKHLLINWRWGEQWFADLLLDFELSSNNGNWQWSAGCGCDAAPYFRIFNPVTQQEKFDPDAVYIRRWVPEWGTKNYPAPMVDLKQSRERCLAAYGAALNPPA